LVNQRLDIYNSMIAPLGLTVARYVRGTLSLKRIGTIEPRVGEFDSPAEAREALIQLAQEHPGPALFPGLKNIVIAE
jgi:hypothetical protein